MDDLADMVEQVTHIPRKNVKMSVSTTTSANMWTDSVSGSMSILDFGFVPGCTIEISVPGNGGAERWSAASSDEESDHEDELDTPLDESDTDDESESEGEIVDNNQRNHPLLQDELAKVVVVKCGKSHYPAVMTPITYVHVSNWFGPSHRFPLGSIRHNVPFPGGRRYLSVR
jgi:hypothetical protein